MSNTKGGQKDNQNYTRSAHFPEMFAQKSMILLTRRKTVVVNPVYRTCPRCEQIVLRIDYGTQPYCRTCTREYRRERRQGNKAPTRTPLSRRIAQYERLIRCLRQIHQDIAAVRQDITKLQPSGTIGTSQTIYTPPPVPQYPPSSPPADQSEEGYYQSGDGDFNANVPPTMHGVTRLGDEPPPPKDLP